MNGKTIREVTAVMKKLGLVGFIYKPLIWKDKQVPATFALNTAEHMNFQNYWLIHWQTPSKWQNFSSTSGNVLVSHKFVALIYSLIHSLHNDVVS